MIPLSLFFVCSELSILPQRVSIAITNPLLFNPISRPYPSHTCLVLHIWALADQPLLRFTPKSPHDTIIFLREHLKKSRIKGLCPRFSFIKFPIYDLRFYSCEPLLQPESFVSSFHKDPHTIYIRPRSAFRTLILRDSHVQPTNS